MSSQTNKKQMQLEKIPTIAQCIDRYDKKRSRGGNDTKSVLVMIGEVDGVVTDRIDKHFEYVLGEAVQACAPDKDLIVVNLVKIFNGELVVMFFRNMGVEVMIDYIAGKASVFALTGLNADDADVEALLTMLFK